MNGFVLAHGRSGTGWVATALWECAGLDARHEWMGRRPGPGYGGVEVNSYLRAWVPELRTRWPSAVLVHLVRDGRDVVRSVMSRHPGPLSFRRRAARWAYLNRRLMDLPHRFRLEDLTAHYHVFRQLALLLGAKDVDEGRWFRLARQRVNSTERHTFPAVLDWPPERRADFWDEAGATMTELGYYG